VAHSYTKCLFHCVFSTKERRNLIPADFQERRWAYMGGIARNNGFAALAVGGTSDHAHALLSLRATLPVATAVQRVKAGASGWLHDTCPALRDFAWQEGYGAFSIGVSQVEDTVRYIARQVAHHHRQTFAEEYVAFLKKHGVEYDERYVLG
jgi:REP element-mobilizing transposase RayT